MKLNGITNIGLVLKTGLAVVISPMLRAYTKINPPVKAADDAIVVRIKELMDGNTIGDIDQEMIGNIARLSAV